MLVLIAAFCVILVVPAFAHYFGLFPDFVAYAIPLMALPPWFLMLSLVWRFDLLRRMLGFQRAPARR